MSGRRKLARALDAGAIAICSLPIAAVILKKLTLGGVYWSLSNYYLLALPGALSIAMAVTAAVLERQRLALHSAAAVLGALCIYAAPALDACMLLTDYERWIQRGMPTRLQCTQCLDALTTAVCESVSPPPQQ